MLSVAIFCNQLYVLCLRLSRSPTGYGFGFSHMTAAKLGFCPLWNCHFSFPWFPTEFSRSARRKWFVGVDKKSQQQRPIEKRTVERRSFARHDLKLERLNSLLLHDNLPASNKSLLSPFYESNSFAVDLWDRCSKGIINNSNSEGKVSEEKTLHCRFSNLLNVSGFSPTSLFFHRFFLL